MVSQVDKYFFLSRRTLILEEDQTSSNSACSEQKCGIQSKLPPEHLFLELPDEQEAQWEDTSTQSVPQVFLRNNLTGKYRQPLSFHPQSCT